MDKINCKICNKLFEKEHFNKIYCSKECYYKSVLNRSKIKYVKKFFPKTLICKECGNSFIQKNWNHKHVCGKDCGKIYYKKIYETIQKDCLINQYLKTRFEILKRDNFTCQYCGRTPKEDKCKLMIDHIIPKSKGGKTIPFNLITSCEECNLGKRDILLENRQLIKNRGKNEKEH